MRRHRGDRPRGGEGAMDITAIAIAVLVGLALLAAAARACSAPLKLLLKVGLNTLVGLAALAVVNATSSFTGVALGLNVFNALVVGVLGAPGLVLLILVQWVLT